MVLHCQLINWLTFKTCILKKEKESIGSSLEDQHNVFMKIFILINILKS